jgi:hypothetical protein
MGELVLLNPKYYVAGLDLSGSYSMHSLAIEADAPEFTSSGDNPRTYKPGLYGAGSEHEGFWDDPVDDQMFAAVGAAASVATLSATGDEGDVAWFYETLKTSYSPGAAVGDAYMFNVSAQPSGPITRGFILATGLKSSSADGTAQELGAVTAAQSLRAAIHVVAVAGASPELDVVVASDTELAFGDTPETRITFAQFTAVGAAAGVDAGVHADTFYRVEWTLGVDTTSATFIVSVGIV